MHKHSVDFPGHSTFPDELWNKCFDNLCRDTHRTNVLNLASRAHSDPPATFGVVSASKPGTWTALLSSSTVCKRFYRITAPFIWRYCILDLPLYPSATSAAYPRPKQTAELFKEKIEFLAARSDILGHVRILILSGVDGPPLTWGHGLSAVAELVAQLLPNLKNVRLFSVSSVRSHEDNGLWNETLAAILSLPRLHTVYMTHVDCRSLPVVPAGSSIKNLRASHVNSSSDVFQAMPSLAALHCKLDTVAHRDLPWPTLRELHLVVDAAHLDSPAWHSLNSAQAFNLVELCMAPSKKASFTLAQVIRIFSGHPIQRLELLEAQSMKSHELCSLFHAFPLLSRLIIGQPLSCVEEYMSSDTSRGLFAAAFSKAQRLHTLVWRFVDSDEQNLNEAFLTLTSFELKTTEMTQAIATINPFITRIEFSYPVLNARQKLRHVARFNPTRLEPGRFKGPYVREIPTGLTIGPTMAWHRGRFADL